MTEGEFYQRRPATPAVTRRTHDRPSLPRPAARRPRALPAPSFTDFARLADAGALQLSDLAEHHAVRTAAGLFDISHMAEILVDRARGRRRSSTTRSPASCRRSRTGRRSTRCCSTSDGGIIDDLVVYRTGDDRFLVVANAGNRDAVAAGAARARRRLRRRGRRRERRHRADRGAGPDARRRSSSATSTGIDRPGVRSTTCKYYRAIARRSSRGAPRAASPAPATPARTASSSTSRRMPPRALWDALLAAGGRSAWFPPASPPATRCASRRACRSTATSSSLDIVPAQAGLGRVVALGQGGRLRRSRRRSRPVRPPTPRCSSASSPRASAPAAPATPCSTRGDAAVGEITSGALSPDPRASDRDGLRRPARARDPAPSSTIDVRGTAHPRDRRPPCPSTREGSNHDRSRPASSTPPSTSGSPSTATSPPSASPTTPPTSSATSSSSTCRRSAPTVDGRQGRRRDRVDEVGRRALRPARPARSSRSNDAVVDDPSLVNTDPFGDGWLDQGRASTRSPSPTLLDRDAYVALTGERATSIDGAVRRPPHRNGCRSPARDARRARLRHASTRSWRRRCRHPSMSAADVDDRHPAGRDRARGARRAARARRRRTRVRALDDRPRLLRHDHAGGDPAQRAREPELVHRLHAVPARDLAGPPRGAHQLPDDGRPTSPGSPPRTRRCSTRRTAVVEGMLLARRASKSASNVFVVDADALPQTKALLRAPGGGRRHRARRARPRTTAPTPPRPRRCSASSCSTPARRAGCGTRPASSTPRKAQGGLAVVAADLLALTLLASPGRARRRRRGRHDASASACRWASAARTPATWPCAPASSASCPAASSACRRMPPATPPTGSRCRPASSTSAARRRRRTSAPRRCCSPSWRRCTRSTTAPTGCKRSPTEVARKAQALADALRAYGRRTVVHDAFFDTIRVHVPGRAPTRRRARASSAAYLLHWSTTTTVRHLGRRDHDRRRPRRRRWAFGLLGDEHDVAASRSRMPRRSRASRRRCIRDERVPHASGVQHAPLRDRA